MRETKQLQDYPPMELDKILCCFFMKARKYNKKSKKYDGEFYQPDSLNSFRNSWQRYLSENKYPFDIKTGNLFERSRKVLAAKRKELVQMGLWNKPNATRPLEDHEVEKLRESGYFSTDNAESLQRLMWWCLTTQFGYRARDESRKLALSDIKLCKDGDGTRYLEWDIERGTKTRTGERSTSHQRAFNPKAFETGSWQCPVNIYEIFVSHRPIEANDGNFPFYLAIRPTNAGNIWYFPLPLGKNKLGNSFRKLHHS